MSSTKSPTSRVVVEVKLAGQVRNLQVVLCRKFALFIKTEAFAWATPATKSSELVLFCGCIVFVVSKLKLIRVS